MFSPLSLEQMEEIVILQMKEVQDRLNDHNIAVQMTDAARAWLAKEGYDPAFGARPLRRAIQKYVESPLSVELLGGKFKDGAVVIVDVDEKEKQDHLPTNAITANIYGQASASPNSFTGTSTSDITNRPTVAPTVAWNIVSANTSYNMGDPWVLGYTRRTPDLTEITNAIMNVGWQNNNPMAFLFKNMTANPIGSRRVISKERAAVTTFQPARLVIRLGQVPKPSVSYYWQSVQNVNGTTIINPTILEIKAKKEAERNQTVLVILDFGATDYDSANIGTKLTSTNISVSTSVILNGSKTYIQKFIQYSQPASHLILGVGTNNTGGHDVLDNNSQQSWPSMGNDDEWSSILG
jgi:hypothetical protein